MAEVSPITTSEESRPSKKTPTGWQQFWTSIGKGTDWFLMDLMVDGDMNEFTVHATGPFVSTFTTDNQWDVSLGLEGYR